MSGPRSVFSDLSSRWLEDVGAVQFLTAGFGTGVGFGLGVGLGVEVTGVLAGAGVTGVLVGAGVTGVLVGAGVTGVLVGAGVTGVLVGAGVTGVLVGAGVTGVLVGRGGRVGRGVGGSVGVGLGVTPGWTGVGRGVGGSVGVGRGVGGSVGVGTGVGGSGQPVAWGSSPHSGSGTRVASRSVAQALPLAQDSHLPKSVGHTVADLGPAFVGFPGVSRVRREMSATPINTTIKIGTAVHSLNSHLLPESLRRATSLSRKMALGSFCLLRLDAQVVLYVREGCVDVVQPPVDAVEPSGNMIADLPWSRNDP